MVGLAVAQETDQQNAAEHHSVQWLCICMTGHHERDLERDNDNIVLGSMSD